MSARSLGESMPRSFVIETDNLPPVVRGWLKAIGLEESDLVELVFTEQELLIRRPLSPQLREWAKATVDRYDKSFRQILGLDEGEEL
ncbi:MAG: hypothetical protein KatS3mg057_3068 [Herpetosiphonaceae bacterium]|nr:MAG: hypothetical protein KatS3mg057_3068 [Herpetosiphonaceae bacterium]